MWPFGKSIQARVEDEIKKYGFLANQPLTVTERGGTVYFNGIVASDSAKKFLEALPNGIGGVKGVDTSGVTVMQPTPDVPEVQPVDEAEVQAAVDSSALAKKVFRAIDQNGELTDDPIDVLQSGSGIVLRGAVDSQHEYNLAVQIAEGEGATSVDASELKIVEGAKQKAKEEVKTAEAAKPAYVNRPDEWHVVKPGETLSGIAQDYLGDASRYTELAQINGINDPNLIRVGQKIQIPR
jgi:nucleoid-associated protein YgaU